MNVKSPHARSARALATWLGASCVVGLSAPAHAQSTGGDARATASESGALDDYLALRIGKAAQRLESAIRQCGDKACSAHVRAHLRLALGFVYGAGNKDLKAARDEFAEALRIEPDIALDPSMRSRDVSRAFRDAQGDRDAASAAALPPSDPVNEEPQRTDSLFAPPLPSTNRVESPPPEAPSADAQRPAKAARDSLALYAEADLALLTPVSNVCSPGGPANWVCFKPDGSRYAGSPQPHLDNNNIRPGLGFSTLRLVAAYDHTLSGRVSLGFRLGFALNGGPTPPGGSGFVPVHAEARVTYDFAGGRSRIAPFAFVSGGLEEVDTRVNVLVVEVPCSTTGPECAITLAAWRRAGYAFFATGGGARLATSEHGAIVADLRVGVTFASVAFVATPEIGYAYTF